MYMLSTLHVLITIFLKKKQISVLLLDGGNDVSKSQEKEIPNKEWFKTLHRLNKKKTRGDMPLFENWNQNTKLMIWSVIEIIGFRMKFVYGITWKVDWESTFIADVRKNLRCSEGFKALLFSLVIQNRRSQTEWLYSVTFSFSINLVTPKGKLWKNAVGAQEMFRRKNTLWSFPQGLDEGHLDTVFLQQF